MKNTSKKNMTLFSLTWPIMIEIFLYMLMGNIDTMMLSQVSDDAVAAVGVTNQIISIVIVLFGFVASGAGIVVAQNLGAEKEQTAIESGSMAIGLNLLFGLLLSLIMFLFAPMFLNLMNVENNLQEYSRVYLIIVGGFLFIQASMMSSSAVLRSYGLTKEVMFITLGMNILNAIGNALFIFGLFGVPKLGVTGVAISTVISKSTGLLVMGLFLYNRMNKEYFLKHLFYFKKKYLYKILKIGIPSAGENLAYSASQVVITYFITLIGTQALTTKVYAQNISMFIFLFALSVGLGTQILVSHLVGGGKKEEAYHSALRSLKISMLVSFSLSLVFYLLSHYLLGIFTDNTEIIKLGVTLFAINILLEPGRTFNLVIINSLRATGDATFPVLIGIMSMFGISVVFSYILGIVLGFGLVGIWISFALDEWLRGILMLLRWRSRVWENKILIDPQQQN